MPTTFSAVPALARTLAAIASSQSFRSKTTPSELETARSTKLKPEFYVVAPEALHMIRSFYDQEPDIADTAYVDSEATVVGAVTVGDDATILPGAVLRGDGGGKVVLETGANVQDNATIHADADGEQVRLAENAAVGHNAIVHNATVGEHSLVGMNSTVLDHATVESYSVVAANSLVREGQRVESGVLVGGSPAETIREDLDPDDRLFETAARYTQRVDGFRAGERVDE